MHSFKDTQGREWRLEANFGSYARVHAATGVRLDDIATKEQKSLEQLQDTFTLGAVLWALIEPQAVALGLTPEQFYEAVDGDVLSAAGEALIDEMIFFCRSGQRKILTMAVGKIREAEKKAADRLEEVLPKLEAEIDEAIDRWASGSSDVSSPASSASILGTGASVN